MKYILNYILERISQHEPEYSGESIILINGFECLDFYDQMARLITNKYSHSDLTINIKLAGKKWTALSSNGSSTSRVSLTQNGWVADTESVTYYRNLHKSNILILMGTEDEDDTGGLKNCFSITPESILYDLNGKYSEIFKKCFTYSISNADCDCIDKMYRSIFEFVAVDIFKLSVDADNWDESFDSFQEFILKYLDSLPDWGLPRRILKPLSRKQIEKKGNFLREEYHFISRKLFSNISRAQYRTLENKLISYDEENRIYSSDWDGWNDQGYNSYNDFCDVLLAFARGEDIKGNKKRLIETDYTIVDDILKIKTKKGSRVLTSDFVCSGDPLHAFLYAILSTLISAKKDGLSELDAIVIEFDYAEVVTGFTDLNGFEKEEQLRRIWTNVCVHAAGVIEFINEAEWPYDNASINIICKNKEFLDVNEVANCINNGLVRTVSGSNTLNKVRFTTKCLDCNGEVIFTEGKNAAIPDGIRQYCWKFKNESGWLYDFSDLMNLKDARIGKKEFIPVGVFDKIQSSMFVKSEEEFFDLYEESDVEWNFNLIDYIKGRIETCNNNNAIAAIKFRFNDLGEKFIKFVSGVQSKGFYYCISSEENKAYIKAYTDLASSLLKTSFPENQQWLLDAFIHAFNIEENKDFLLEEEETRCCIVPPWHPAALQKLCDQKRFILDGVQDAWKTFLSSNKALNITSVLFDVTRTSEIQAAVDLFPAEGYEYYGIVGTYGTYSVYGISNKASEIKLRVKDIIKKEAIFDEDIRSSDFVRMNDDAKMIYDVIRDYIKAFPSTRFSMSLAFINPAELQPIIAAIYRYTSDLRKEDAEHIINIRLSILVRPENKGGRNYLTYWMDDYFAKQHNTVIRTYLNEWVDKKGLDGILSTNNDIIFNMDLLRVNTYSFVADMNNTTGAPDECRFPVVYKPSPISNTSKKRRIELSQPQFTATFSHTQIVRYKRNSDTIPSLKYIAVRESSLGKETKEIIELLHKKSYWVVCVDKVMDGALLKDMADNQYPIIGFSTGKGIYGQYNLTITARNSILETVRQHLANRLKQLFHWNKDVLDLAVDKVIDEAGSLDGVSLFSAINQHDSNINEFMAYVLTSLREEQKQSDQLLRIIVHLDSYKHWFKNEEDSSSRPDFLMLSVMPSDGKLKLDATVIECKISSYKNAERHIEKACSQVSHGLDQLQCIFDPASSSLERRYWYSQLYRALVFAQVTFSNNTEEFESLTGKLRAILDGEFEIDWEGVVLGYWIDMPGTDEDIQETSDHIKIYNIPQLRIQNILTGSSESSYIEIGEWDNISDGETDEWIKATEDRLKKELEESNHSKRNQTLKKNYKSKSADSVDHESKITAETAKKTTLEESQKEDGKISHSNLSLDTNKPEKTSYENTGTQDSETDLTKSRIKIGKDRGGTDVYWEFGHTQLANRHLLITGTSGQGKTYSIQTMLYEISKSNISTVIFDYTEGFRADQLEKKFMDKMENCIDSRIVYFTGVPINPFKRNEIEVAGMHAPEKISDVAQRIANILTHVYKFGEQQFAAVYEACRIGLEKYGDAMNMQYLEAELNQSNNKSAKTVVSKMAPFFHSVEFTGDDFDWKNVLYCPDSKVTIFQLTNFVRDIQVIITEFLLWDMWHYTKKFGNKDNPFVVVLDEAQNLSHTLSSPSGMILTEGRKFGWSAWYATQSLKVLSEDEIVRLMQSAFKLYFKPTDEEIVSMAKQLNPMDSNEWKEPLTNLKKGQCIVVGSRIQKNGRFGTGRPTITNVTPFEERE